MACNCGGGTRIQAAGNRSLAVNAGFDQARQAIKQRSVMAPATKQVKKYCPGCRTYGVKTAAMVVKCPLCGTTFSAAVS